MPKTPALLVLTLLLAWGCGQQATDKPGTEGTGSHRRPNILWITAEDLSPRLAAYGDSLAHTPNLDWLAAEGITYTNAYSTSGVCAPSRHTLITGMYPTSTGGNMMRTIAHSVAFDHLPDSLLPPVYSVITPPEVKCFSEYLRQAGYYTTNRSKTDYQFQVPLSAWDENGQQADFSHAPDSMPFFSVYNFFTTHESQIWQRDSLPRTIDSSRLALPPFYPDEPAIRHELATHYNNIEELDRQIGQLLDRLKTSGQLANTLIFFFGDHGDGIPRYKREVYDSGIRVPFIVRFPDKRFAGSTDDRLVSFVDFAPTVLSLAGLKAPDHMQGFPFLGEFQAPERNYIFAAKDRMDTVQDQVRAVRDKEYKYIRNYMPNLPLLGNVTYRRKQKTMTILEHYRHQGKLGRAMKHLFATPRPKEELYHLPSDPFELHNLIDSASHSGKREELRQALQQWIATTGDLHLRMTEEQLLAEWWNGKKQAPKTANVRFVPEKGALKLDTETQGASIVWRYKKNPKGGWKLYTRPISPADVIEATAVRIGHQQSDTTVYQKP